MSRILSINNLSKTYYSGSSTLMVLKDLNIQLDEGQFVSLIGPSGCGKSTIFNILCGIENASSGEIKSNADFGYMPQKDLLMDWKRLFENIVLPLKLKRELNDESRIKVLKMMKVFGLDGFENSYPNELSGGMKQRAALLRTFLTGSSIMLLDEPFASLDSITREKMQEWLLEIWELEKRSVLFVTHSVDEAIFLSDRIYVLSDRPSRVMDIIDVDIRRPRSRDVLTSAKFNEYKKRIMEQM